MFVMAVPDNKAGRDGCYCSLVESKQEDGKIVHKTLLRFGYIPFDRVPYLKAAYGKGDPDAIVAREKASMADKRERYSKAPSGKK